MSFIEIILALAALGFTAYVSGVLGGALLLPVLIVIGLLAFAICASPLIERFTKH